MADEPVDQRDQPDLELGGAPLGPRGGSPGLAGTEAALGLIDGPIAAPVHLARSGDACRPPMEPQAPAWWSRGGEDSRSLDAEVVVGDRDEQRGTGSACLLITRGAPPSKLSPYKEAQVRL